MTTAETESGVYALDGQTFDLSRVASKSPLAARSASRWLLGIGLAFLVGWGVAILPNFFLPARALWWCYRGCVLAPASAYWIGLALWTGVVLFLGVFATVLGLASGRPAPTRVSVGQSGLTFVLPTGRTFFERWPSRWAYIPLNDYRQSPRSYQSRNPPGDIRAGGRACPLTGDAIDGILSMARSVGESAEARRLDYTRRSEDPGVVITYYITGKSKKRP